MKVSYVEGLAATTPRVTRSRARGRQRSVPSNNRILPRSEIFVFLWCVLTVPPCPCSCCSRQVASKLMIDGEMAFQLVRTTNYIHKVESYRLLGHPRKHSAAPTIPSGSVCYEESA